MRAHALIFLLFCLLTSHSYAHVRSISAFGDDILTVRTALGIATIIQLPESIQSAIIGDQSGFKIEYLDRAVTIKPLRFGVKTNLYLVTEKRRYNIRLVTQTQQVADYVVYVKNSEPSKSFHWYSLTNEVEARDLHLKLKRVGISSGAFILVDAEISSTDRTSTTIKPEDIWIKQDGNSKVINGLYLSDLRFSKSKPIKLGISLSKSDLPDKRAITIEIHTIPMLTLTISENFLWK